MKDKITKTVAYDAASLWCALAAMAILMVCTSCSEQQESFEPEGVVAQIGKRFITIDDLQIEARRRQTVGLPVLSKEELLEAMLEQEALLIRAGTKQLAEDPAIKFEIDRLLIARLRERELMEKLKAYSVSEEEIRQTYQQNLDTYVRPALDRLAMLFLRIEKNASDAKRKGIRGRMDAAQREAEEKLLKNGFGSLSISCSDDQISRYRGGDIGWIARDKSTARLPDQVLEIGRALEKGTMSNINEAEDGLYLVMKTDFRPCSTTTYEQVRGSLRQRLLNEGRTAIEQAYLQECIQSVDAQINEGVLAGLELQAVPQPKRHEEISPLAGGLPVAAESR